MKLSLCMIVKNEEETLGRCLDSVSDFVDEMIVVDTGSTDSTVAVASERGAKVFFEAWTDDFAAARNRSLKEASGDWILVMDADEEFCAEDVEKVSPLLRDVEAKCYLVETISRSVSDAAAGEARAHRNPRLFRNDPEFRFEGIIHEEIALESDKRRVIKEAPVRIFHYGYHDASEEKKRDRQKRNNELLSKALSAHPDDPTFNYYLAETLLEAGDYRQALDRLKRSQANFPDHGYLQPVIAQNIISCLIDLGRPDEALSEVNAALRRFPNYSEFHYFAGEIYTIANHHDQALECFKRCVEQKDLPAVRSHETRLHVEAMFAIGVSNMNLGLNKQAEVAFAAYLKIAPDDDIARGYLARVQ